MLINGSTSETEFLLFPMRPYSLYSRLIPRSRSVRQSYRSLVYLEIQGLCCMTPTPSF